MPHYAPGRRRRYLKKRKRKFEEIAMATARKTAAERATERENARVLAEYFATHEAKKETDREDRRLRRAADLVPDGQWGDYIKTYGDGKAVMDQDAVKARFEALGEPVPMKLTHSVIVRKVGS